MKIDVIVIVGVIGIEVEAIGPVRNSVCIEVTSAFDQGLGIRCNRLEFAALICI